jgi:hypothetical protein
MPRKATPDIQEKDLHGFKHFKLLMPLLERLHDDGCRRDKAGNRILHYDQYASLILLYFFNPIITSLRAIQQASELQKVQRVLKCQRASLGSLSEAARVFDPDLLVGIIGELIHQLPVTGDQVGSHAVIAGCHLEETFFVDLGHVRSSSGEGFTTATVSRRPRRGPG